MKNSHNMLISFTINNFCSIKSEQEFSMVAAPIVERFDDCNENIVSIDHGIELLKSAVIYGANGSGKSNFLKAFDFFKNFVFNSSALTINQKILINPFLLNNKSRLNGQKSG